MGWELFSQKILFEIGVGSQVRFWHDCWCSDQPLKVAFLVFYENSFKRKASIEALLVRQMVGERWSWNVMFHQDCWKLQM